MYGISNLKNDWMRLKIGFWGDYLDLKQGNQYEDGES